MEMSMWKVFCSMWTMKMDFEDVKGELPQMTFDYASMQIIMCTRRRKLNGTLIKEAMTSTLELLDMETKAFQGYPKVYLL